MRASPPGAARSWANLAHTSFLDNVFLGKIRSMSTTGERKLAAPRLSRRRSSVGRLVSIAVEEEVGEFASIAAEKNIGRPASITADDELGQPAPMAAEEDIGKPAPIAAE